MKLVQSNQIEVRARGRHRVVTLDGRELGMYCWVARRRPGYRLRVGNVTLSGRCRTVGGAVRCIVDWSLTGQLPVQRSYPKTRTRLQRE